jgi:hypothetical protein
MERIILTDKTSWYTGPWQHEADLVRWMDFLTGYPCIIARDTVSGTWCGYVGIAYNHPLYHTYVADPTFQYISVHGGVSYAGFLPRQELWITPAQRHWWVGFDCTQEFDLCPLKLDDEFVDARVEYRTEEYAQNETMYLAEQLQQMEVTQDE